MNMMYRQGNYIDCMVDNQSYDQLCRERAKEHLLDIPASSRSRYRSSTRAPEWVGSAKSCEAEGMKYESIRKSFIVKTLGILTIANDNTEIVRSPT